MCCYRRLNQSVLIAYSQISYKALHGQMRIQRGDRGSVPPGKSQVICIFSLEKVGPPTPLENVGPPLDPWKSKIFSLIKPLDPLCKL